MTIFVTWIMNCYICHPCNLDSDDYALIDDKNMKHPSSENTPVTADSTNRDMSSKMSDSNLKSVK